MLIQELFENIKLLKIKVGELESQYQNDNTVILQITRIKKKINWIISGFLRIQPNLLVNKKSVKFKEVILIRELLRNFQIFRTNIEILAFQYSDDNVKFLQILQIENRVNRVIGNLVKISNRVNINKL